jgi:hypothetical protein
MTWSARKQAIVSTLTQKVRFLSVDQVIGHWWPVAATRDRNARREIAALVDAGYLARQSLLATPLPPLEAPVFTWQPGEPEPAYGALSYQLQRRWTAGVREVTVLVATRKALGLFGGVAAGVRVPDQATHDLAMGAIYLQFLRHAPDAARQWVSEDGLARLQSQERRAETGARGRVRLDKVPDAALVDAHGRRLKLIEFGGSYHAARVKKTHLYAAERQLPYELW